MTIQWDTFTDTLLFEGKEIGRFSKPDSEGKVTVTFTLSYRCAPSDAHLPLIALSTALSKIPEYERKRLPPDLTVTLGEDSIAETYDVPRLLEEKQIKAGGYVWEFNKTDADPWPSALHAHDYEYDLKLDAITGDIYDVGKRYIAFNQSFNTYTNAWTIDRNTLKYSVKTILKPGSRIVIDEKGSCANAAAAAKSRPRGHTAASLWTR